VTGVILAGGQGSRMGVLGEQYPKALLPVANEPLLVHHLRLLERLGVRRVYVVLGHRAEDVARALGDGTAYGVRVVYVEQGPRLGSAHALGCLRPHVREPFLLVLGDYYFVASEPERMLRRLHEGVSALAVKREPDVQLIRDACAVELDATARVVRIVEKPFAPTTNVKGCGFYALQPEFFDAVARTPRTALRDEYELTVSLEQYVNAGGPLYGEEIIARDANLTRPEDLLACNVEWLESAGRTALVADEADVDAGLTLRHALVGRGAHVEGVTSLEQVVVFPGAHLRGSGALRRTLVTSAGCFSCDDGASALASDPRSSLPLTLVGGVEP
jgi:dTDP-glucose pyrophosphorylase